MKAAASHARRVYEVANHSDKPLELQVQSLDPLTDTPQGFVTQRVYDDLQDRFRILQEELIDRDVELAQTMLQLAIERRNTIRNG